LHDPNNERVSDIRTKQLVLQPNRARICGYDRNSAIVPGTCDWVYGDNAEHEDNSMVKVTKSPTFVQPREIVVEESVEPEKKSVEPKPLGIRELILREGARQGLHPIKRRSRRKRAII
jgi:hypothetical protein